MRWHADLVEAAENILGNAIVQNALPLETLMLLGVERSRVVLEVLNERAGFRPFIKDLRLSFIDAATAVIHWETPFL